ncbi:MAG: alpha/beta hydrolase [Oceanospirillaceae bacterium]|nr:alpha/beta hydrolase [Oceanospirillaceae bacterium]
MLRAIVIKNNIIVFSCLTLLGCANLSDNTLAISAHYGLTKHSITTSIYNHNYFQNHAYTALRTTGKLPEKTTIHLYIGSDGTPWIKGRWIAADPTPSDPLALKLMGEDKNPAIYLSRPCYFDDIKQSYCHASLWSSARYSKNVITSMALAIKQLINIDNEIILLGYSGGAAIAVLLADQLDNVVGLVTIAGNLNTDLWTTHHQLSPLTQSINPSRYQYLKKPIKSIHLAANNDKVIPLPIIQSYIAIRGGKLHIFNNADHRCCWLEKWPENLKEINSYFSMAE